MRGFLRDNGIGLFFGALFLVTLAAEAAVGNHLFNEEQAAHGEPGMGLFRYLLSSDFGARVTENWQSEFLQFATLIVASVWLLQRGSPESKELGKAGGGTDREQRVGAHAGGESPPWARVGDIRQTLYANSLGLLFAALFLASWLAQSLTSRVVFNSEQAEHGEQAVSWIGYLGTADFWDRSLQNWQSEFLAVATMAVFAVYLRQRGSPESKPVGAPHHKTST